MFIAYLLRVVGELEPIPVDFGQETGYSLGRSPVYLRANTEANSHSHTFPSYTLNSLHVLLIPTIKMSENKMSYIIQIHQIGVNVNQGSQSPIKEMTSLL